MTFLSDLNPDDAMNIQEIVLGALRGAGRPLASQQIWELPACVELTRQQVWSAVGHLRKLGKIEETWEKVANAANGPKAVRQYRVSPQEEGLAEALAAGQVLREAEAAARSRLEATRIPRPDRPIPPTSPGHKPAPGHPFTHPISPKAPPRRGRVTRDLPTHLTTPAPDADGATQEAQFIAAEAAAEATALAEAETWADLATGADAAGGDTPSVNLADRLSPEARLIYTNLDTELVAELAAVCGADARPTPAEETAMATDRPLCNGHCQQGKTADYAAHGDPCAVHADEDLDHAQAVAPAGAPGTTPADRPGWVAELQAWLGPLPIDLSLYQISARLMTNVGPGELRLKTNDDGGGPFIRLGAQGLALNSGELSQLDRYASALIWIYDAIQLNAHLLDHSINRPAGLDQPSPRAAWDDDLRPQRSDGQGAGGGAEYRSQRLDDPTDKDWRPRRIDDPF